MVGLNKTMKTLVCIAVLLGVAIAKKPYWEDLNFVSKESKEEGQHAGPKATNCSCGWTNKGRIVGGRETLVNEFPLMAGLVYKEESLLFCGATILTQYHALSATHCTREYKDKQIYLVVGEHDITKNSEKDAALYPVAKTIEHEQYNEITLANDVALVVVKRKIDFTQTVGPACLPNKILNLNNEHVKVLGWGLIKSRGEQSPVLMKVNLKVIPTKDCFISYPIDFGTPDIKNVICTFRHGKDSCEGDSGGPVIWLDPETNRYTLVGLVSHGKICAEDDAAVNTNVAYYLPWIQRKIASTGGAHTCAKKIK